MDRVSVTGVLLLVVAVALGFLVLWLRRNAPGADRLAGCSCRIGFSPLDNMASISLVLSNESHTFVWIEEIEVFLSDLTATDQMKKAPGRETQKIRQMIRPGDVLSLSLAGTIYKAAGEPQRAYSCVLASTIRCRAGEEGFQRPLKTYRLRMNGLTATSIHPERRKVPRHPDQEKASEIAHEETEIRKS